MSDAPSVPVDDASPLERTLGYRFRSRRLLADALTHPSLAGSRRVRPRRGAGAEGHGCQGGQGSDGNSGAGIGTAGTGGGYERLEFLGDRVLGLVIAEWLLVCFPEEAEGGLAKRHVALVRRESLSQVAETLCLGDYLRLSAGEAVSGGRQNASILADACEALIGALYLDDGLETARRFVHRYWAPLLEAIERPPQDAKTMLQEWAQARGLPLPRYTIVDRSGPAHRPVFVVSVDVMGLPTTTRDGGSRRAAEQAAAAALLERLAAPGESGSFEPESHGGQSL